jgi:response regulator RpfG family c-di-GMP phosphodiesterase
MHPRSGSLEGFSDTVDVLVSDYSKESDVVRNLIDMSSTDYSTILQSINVMAFALGFATHMGYSRIQAKNLGLSALLHDVGKTKIDRQILTAPRKLSREEFDEMKSHTTKGYDILKECNFGQPDIALGALEHYEKLDGTGYPNGKRNILMTSQVIKILIVCQRDSCCRADGDLSLPELAPVMPYQFPITAKRNVDQGLGKTSTKKAQSYLALS